MIAIVVNGERRDVADDLTVAGLVATLVASPKGIAVARNGEVVPRSMWDDTILQADDALEVLTAAQGG